MVVPITLIETPKATQRQSFAEAMLLGLSSSPKSIPQEWLYDERGSKLFEKITVLPEYYQTRSERYLLQLHSKEIVSFTSGPIRLVEFGSGNSLKTRVLIEQILERQDKLHYIPIDISRDALRESALNLVSEYRRLRVTCIAGSYQEALGHLPKEGLASLTLFLGGNLGNLGEQEAQDILSRVSEFSQESDRLLIGYDVVKDPAVILAAYNDSQGVTAEFNKNLLRRANEELGANFNLEEFRHEAIYDQDRATVIMSLVSTEDQSVDIQSLARIFYFTRGERIQTELSRKYTPASFERMAKGANLSIDRFWADEADCWHLALLRPEKQPITISRSA